MPLRATRCAALCAAATLLSAAAFAQKPTASPGITGKYNVTMDYFGTPIFWPLELTETSGKLTGELAGDKLEGTRTGDHIHFFAKDNEGGTEDVDATLRNGKMSGTILQVEPDDPKHTANRHAFTAEVRPVPDPSRKPQRHDFIPATFYRQFSPLTAPVLHVWPGDTVHTTTVDAGGTDEKGVHRVPGGNPETGPFYIETAMPGDMLVVQLNRVRLNRDYAISDDAIVPRGLSPNMAAHMKDLGKNVRWHLDLDKGIATSNLPGDHLKSFTVPLKPMLGCVATAPGPGSAPPPTGDSGGFGGNMDFNEVVEGATVYLPVSTPGALLYLGDGHAAQGDGELNGNALETSMDVEFTVSVLPGKRAPNPRIETDTHLIAMGLDGSLDDAFRRATDNMASWLNSDYNLTPSEIAQVIGTSAEYRVSEVADRNAGIVLKIRKDRLANIQRASKPASSDPSIPTVVP